MWPIQPTLGILELEATFSLACEGLNSLRILLLGINSKSAHLPPLAERHDGLFSSVNHTSVLYQFQVYINNNSTPCAFRFPY